MTIILDEIFVDEWCESCNEQHRGILIRMRKGNAVQTLLQDNNWTPVETIRAFLEEVCGEEVVMAKDM